MKITAVSTVGTYHSWIKWGIASVYNSVDNVIIINGGYDTEHPLIGDNIPLIRELQQIKEIDIDNKITQVKPTEERLKQLLGKDLDWSKCEKGRARNITLAFQLAYHTGADWVLKFDSDQIFDENFTRTNLEALIDTGNGNSITGYRFAEYADFYRDWDRIQAFPGNFTDDGTLFFKANRNAWAVGGGSPVHYSEQREIHDMRSFHMRRISPSDVEESDYHYKRLWYHTYGPNSINEWKENGEVVNLSLAEIRIIALEGTQDLMNTIGKTRNEFPEELLYMFPPGKPPVVEIGPEKYIAKGMPNENIFNY